METPDPQQTDPADGGDRHDDELVARLRRDVVEARPASALERDAPVDIEEPPVDLDEDGVG